MNGHLRASSAAALEIVGASVTPTLTRTLSEQVTTQRRLSKMLIYRNEITKISQIKDWNFSYCNLFKTAAVCGKEQKCHVYNVAHSCINKAGRRHHAETMLQGFHVDSGSPEGDGRALSWTPGEQQSSP